MTIDLIQGLTVAPEHISSAKTELHALVIRGDGMKAHELVGVLHAHSKELAKTDRKAALYGQVYWMRLVDRLLQNERAAGRLRYANRSWFLAEVA